MASIPGAWVIVSLQYCCPGKLRLWTVSDSQTERVGSVLGKEGLEILRVRGSGGSGGPCRDGGPSPGPRLLAHFSGGTVTPAGATQCVVSPRAPPPQTSVLFATVTRAGRGEEGR